MTITAEQLRATERWFYRRGLPFLPVTPTFPLLGPLGALPLPAKWVISFGEPLATPPHTPELASDDLLVARLTEELRAEVQRLVKEALAIRRELGAGMRAGLLALELLTQ